MSTRPDLTGELAALADELFDPLHSMLVGEFWRCSKMVG
jgi:hypothetical protein